MRCRVVVLCVGLLAPARPALAQGQGAAASFDALKRLAGNWTGSVTTEPHNQDLEGAIQVTVRVASRGSVLEHEIAPGGVPEPTMIYVEGNRLTLVHYCEAGNRPRLVARPSANPKVVDFEFADLSGSTEPVYLRTFVFTMIATDHHTEDWVFGLPGDKQLRAHFDLNRATPAASGKAGAHPH